MRLFKTLFLTLSLAFPALCQTLVPRYAWTVETSEPYKARRLDLVYGETVDLECRFLAYTRPMELAGASVVLHGRTNGMAEGSSFQVAGSASSNGLAAVRLPVDAWVPQGLTNFLWTLEVTQTNAARLLRSGGTVSLTASSTASTNAPVPTLWLSDLRAEIAAAVAAVPSDKLWSTGRTQFADSTGGLWRVESAWSLDVPETGFATNVWGLGYPVTNAVGYPGPMFTETWVADLLYLTVGLRADGDADFILYDGRDGSSLWMTTTNTAASIVVLRPSGAAVSNAVLRFTPGTVRTNLYGGFAEASLFSGYATTGALFAAVSVVSTRVEVVNQRLSGYAPITNAVLYDADGVAVLDTIYKTVGGNDYGFDWELGELWGNIRLPNRYAEPTADSLIKLSEAQALVAPLATTQALVAAVAPLASTQLVAAAVSGLAGTQQVSAAVAPLAPTNAPVLFNLTARGWLALPQTQPTNLVLRLVCSNGHIIVEESYP